MRSCYRMKRSMLFILLVLACFSSKVNAEEGVSDLKSWVGCYPNGQGNVCKSKKHFFDLPDVKSNLKAILKNDEYTLLTRTYGVSSPIIEKDNYLFITGFRPHSAGEKAILLMGLKKRDVLVIFYLSYPEKDDLENTACISNGKQLYDLSDDLKEEILGELTIRENEHDRLLPNNLWINKVPCRIGKK
jgi:hypothetical protein